MLKAFGEAGKQWVTDVCNGMVKKDTLQMIGVGV